VVRKLLSPLRRRRAPWRKSEMIEAKSIKPHMQVICSNNEQLGLVDHVEGDNAIKLTKDRMGKHHFIPMAWVTNVGDKVYIDRSNKRAMSEWRDRVSMV
jgi:hypothetical protein